MNRMIGLLLALVSLTSFSACDVAVPQSTEPAEVKVLSQALVPNANWELDLGSGGNVQGDVVEITVFGNGQSVPVGMEVILRDSQSNAIIGSFQTTSYQLGGTYQTGIRGFNVSGGPNLLMGAPQSAIPSATVTMPTSTTAEISFDGKFHFRLYPGEGTQEMGEFSFEMGTDIVPDDQVDQLPIPDGDFEELGVDEPEMCPVWIFDETEFGNRIDGSPSQRSDKLRLTGDEVRTGWNGNRFVIQMESNLVRPDGELFGVTVMLDQIPTQGALTTYPVQVFSAIDNKKVWTIDAPGTGTLEIVDWSQGAFNGVITFDNFELRDDDAFGTLNYWERSVDGELWFFAPLPQYNDSYDDLCTHFEEDVEWSILATIQKVIDAAYCAVQLREMRENCDARILIDPNAHPIDKVLAAGECVFLALLVYDACMEVVP